MADSCGVHDERCGCQGRPNLLKITDYLRAAEVGRPKDRVESEAVAFCRCLRGTYVTLWLILQPNVGFESVRKF